ncbi:unnamed protein product [Calypogeia fissa]
MAVRSSTLILPQVSGISFLGTQVSKLPCSRCMNMGGARRKRLVVGRNIIASMSSSSGTMTLNSVYKGGRPSSLIRKIQEELMTGEKSAMDVTEEYLTRLRDREPQVQSFLHISERAMEEARTLDEKISQGGELGLLAGVPIAVKDNLCTKDMPSTGGSKILEGYKPPYDATAVRKLREEGAVIIGKTNMDEFGMGSSCENSGFKKTANPWDLARVPGGSSGGSAAAVAARQCAGSLGSDTGGSIRLPASFCGVVGLKPSYGRVSRYGLMAYASSLDVVGCLGSSVLDAAILLQAIAGYDKADSTCSHKDVPNFVEPLLVPIDELPSKPLAGVKFGLLTDTLGEGVDSGVASAVRSAAMHLEELGATVVEVSVSTFSLGLPAYYVLAASEASSNLSRYDGARYGNRADAPEMMTMYAKSRADGLGAEVKRRILMGTYALSAGYYDAYYKRAQQVRTLIQSDLKAAFEDIDVLLSPVSSTPAYKLGEKVDDPLAMYAGDLMTVNVNLAGLPALVVPCGLAEGGSAGLPIGLQMIGKSFEEAKLLRLGHLYEQTAPAWCTAPPALVQT